MTDRSNLFWSRLPGRSGKVKWPVQMLDTDNSQKVTVFCRADEAYFRVDHEQLEPFPGQIDKLKQNCIDILTGSDGTDDRAEPRAEDKLEHGADDRAECEAHHDPEEAYASSGDDDYMKKMLEEAGSGDDEEEFDGKRKRKSQKRAPKRQKFSQVETEEIQYYFEEEEEEEEEGYEDEEVQFNFTHQESIPQKQAPVPQQTSTPVIQPSKNYTPITQARMATPTQAAVRRNVPSSQQDTRQQAPTKKASTPQKSGGGMSMWLKLIFIMFVAFLIYLVVINMNPSAENRIPLSFDEHQG